jgi:outer membrane protein OmpA-like peptidoglycan-associated protein
MINSNFFKTLFMGLMLLTTFGAVSQMTYEEFHERYTPTYETIVPNSSLVKSVNEMSDTKAAGQVTNSTKTAVDGDEDSKLSILAVLTSCKRSKVAGILREMEPEYAVQALKIMKPKWIKEIMFFVDKKTYYDLAPHLQSEMFIPLPEGPFGPIVNKMGPAYAGIFYDHSYTGLKGMNEIIDGYGDSQTINTLKGFGFVGGFWLKEKESMHRFLDVTFQTRGGKTKYESLGFTNSKFRTNTFALNYIKATNNAGFFVVGHGPGLQFNMLSYKAENSASKFKKLGGGMNGGLNYNGQLWINPKKLPIMIGARAYAQINLPSVDFNPLADTLFNFGTPSDNDDYKSSVATFGIQVQALYKFGKAYEPKEYKSFEDEYSEFYDKNMNTTYDELTPRVSADGKTLYFVRENHPLNTSGTTGSQDVWIADVSNGVEKSTALHLEKPFNQRSYNSIVGISPDGTSMVIKGRYSASGEYLGKGYSMMNKTSSGWSDPKELDVDGYASMAKGTYVGAHWSTDGKHLILSLSENKDDDNQDVYVSHLSEDGTWTKPKSVGKTINTDGDENGPFLASDGKTLYFSSNRDGGYGSNDIWMSQRKDDSWTNWTEPVNLGEDVNTEEWESYYTIDAQGKYAYMVSYQNSKDGSADIARIKLKEEVQPDPVVLVRGKVLDQKTNKPVSARIVYNGIDDGKNYGVANSDPETGAYTIVLPYGVNYEFTASASNYIGVSDNLDLTTVGEYKEIEKDLLLVPIEVGATVRLNNIFFETGKSDLKKSSFAELDRVVKFLADNPNVTVEISGHTDNVGNKDFNKKLSQERANAVTKYLVSKGVDKARLTTKGYGMEKPVADNSTEQGKTLNRRVEFTILSNN